MGSSQSSKSMKAETAPAVINDAPPANLPKASKSSSKYGLTSLKSQIDMQTGRLKTGATLNRKGCSKKLTLEHEYPSNAIAARLEGKRWSATYEHPNKDIKLVYYPVFKRGEWRITQKIPQAHLAVFPSPEVEVKFNGPLRFGKSMKDSLTLSYCYLTRTGVLHEKVSLLNGRCEVKAEVNSKTGISGADVAVLYKPGKQWAKQLGWYYNKSAGSSLSWKGEVADDTKVSGTLDLATGVAKLSLDLEQSEGTTVSVSAKLGPNQKKLPRPALTVGLKTSF